MRLRRELARAYRRKPAVAAQHAGSPVLRRRCDRERTRCVSGGVRDKARKRDTTTFHSAGGACAAMPAPARPPPAGLARSTPRGAAAARAVACAERAGRCRAAACKATAGTGTAAEARARLARRAGGARGRSAVPPPGGVGRRTAEFLKSLSGGRGAEASTAVDAPPLADGDAGDGAAADAPQAVYYARAWRLDAQHPAFPEEARFPPPPVNALRCVAVTPLRATPHIALHRGRTACSASPLRARRCGTLAWLRYAVERAAASRCALPLVAPPHASRPPRRRCPRLPPGRPPASPSLAAARAATWLRWRSCARFARWAC